MLKLIHIYTNIFLLKKFRGGNQCMPPFMGVPLGIVDSNCHHVDLVPPLRIACLLLCTMLGSWRNYYFPFLSWFCRRPWGCFSFMFFFFFLPLYSGIARNFNLGDRIMYSYVSHNYVSNLIYYDISKLKLACNISPTFYKYLQKQLFEKPNISHQIFF